MPFSRYEVSDLRLSRTSADLLLLFVCIIWGGSFVIVRDSVRIMPPLFLIGGRFVLAFIAVALCFPRSFRAWRANLPFGVLLSLPLLGGFITQTLGLRYTTASNSGFITGFNVILVALLAAIFRTQKLKYRTMFGVLLATVGLVFLSWQPGGWSFGRGDLLTLACAVFFALHIVATGVIAPDRDPVALAGIQFATVALASLLLNPVAGGGFHLPSVQGFLALVYLGLGGTAFAYLMQTSAQRHTSSVDTALIFATEPLFAAAIAVLLGGEHLALQALIGGGSIIIAMLIAVSAQERNQAVPAEANPGG